MKNKWPFGINYFCQFILLFGLLFLLFMDLTTLFILFIGPTVLFQLTFTFIYNTFNKSFQLQLNKLFSNEH